MSIDDDAQPVDGDSTCASVTVCEAADSGQRSAVQPPSECPLKPLSGTAQHDQGEQSPRKAAIEGTSVPRQMRRTSCSMSPPPVSLPPVRMGPPPPPPMHEAVTALYPPAPQQPLQQQQQQRQAGQRQVPTSAPRFNPLPPVPASVRALGVQTGLQQPWPGLAAGSNGVFMPVQWVGAPKAGVMHLW